MRRDLHGCGPSMCVSMSRSSTISMFDRRNVQLALRNLFLIILCPISFRGSASASPSFFFVSRARLLDARVGRRRLVPTRS